METEQIVDSPVPPETGASGASGQATDQVAPVSTETKPVTVDTVAHLNAINTILQPIGDVLPPKEYSPEAMKQYETERANVQKYRDFQNGMREVASTAVEVAPGVVHVFTSPAEVQSFSSFARERLQHGVTAKDLVVLHSLPRLLADAERRGERNYEKRLKAGTAAATQQKPPASVAPPVETTRTQPGRTLTVKELFQKNSPDAFNKFMQGTEVK
jgi:hypothetical protein